MAMREGRRGWSAFADQDDGWGGVDEGGWCGRDGREVADDASLFRPTRAAASEEGDRVSLVVMRCMAAGGLDCFARARNDGG